MALGERSVTEQRYEAVIQALRHEVPVTEVAARFGVSRQSVHTWIRRYQADGLAGLADCSHRPSGCPHQVPADVEAAVCQLRKAHPKWGPQRLLHEVERRGTIPLPSRSAVYQFRVRRGLIEPKAARKRRYKRWERDSAMQLWQIDVMVRGVPVRRHRGQGRHRRGRPLPLLRPHDRGGAGDVAGGVRRVRRRDAPPRRTRRSPDRQRQAVHRAVQQTAPRQRCCSNGSCGTTASRKG